MFQFNANDLDFGIYRIYNLKRKEIENFIDDKDEQCLEPIINKTLEQVSNIEKQVELTSLTTYLKKFNQDSLVNDSAGNFKEIQTLIEFSKDDSEKENLTIALTASTKEFNITDEIKDKIYNHILGYFEMYYSNGDFGYNNRSRSLYKVPYEADYDGNDTMFHWKHKGSLYIKTGNSFNAIKFKLKHLNKEFELRLETNEDSTSEEVARNNNKDTKLKHYKFNRFEEKEGITRIVFNLSDASTTKADLFKSLFKDVFEGEKEIENYLFAEGKPVFNDLKEDYDKVLDGSVKGIGALRVNRKTLLNKVNKNFERGNKIEIINESGQERFSDETMETIYNIDQKLNSFYIGNDSDYFIHENLQEFLTQEKERYIKNHILSDLKSILDGKLDNTTLIIAKAFELVSSRIIEFLSSIEEFQKQLFTMKKKVVESEYCLTIDNIDEKYYKEILENKTQLTEWENLFSVKVKNLDDLKAQLTLVLDTKFFKQKDGSNPFKDKILAEIENLDERTNGLLINSENYQGLNTISNRYNGQVNCIHIDPPYNSNTSGFLYKNHFRHSSWISMMENRLSLGFSLLSKDGDLLCHIDENEYENLHQLMNLYKIGNAGTLIWDKRNPMNGGSGLALQHEYVLWNTNRTSAINFRNENAIVMLKMADKLISDAGSVSDSVRKKFSKWISSNKDLTGGDKAYRFIDDNGQVYQSVSLRAPEPRTDEKFFQPLIHPVTKKPCSVPPNGFSRTPETLKKMMDNDEILFGSDETTQPRQKVTLNSEVKKQMPSVIQDAKKGKSEIAAMGLTFPYNHSTTLYEKLIGTAIGEIDGIVLDFFAGSGTSGQAVININRIGSRNIKFILMEMGTYFSSITKPRILKSIYSSKWKAKKPELGKGSKNQIIKYAVLEQYEDILDAIEQFEGETPKNLPLKYLYKPELNKINSTLDLSKPFGNKIKYGQPTKEGFVDLVDTYNYLQGYEVKSIKTYTIGKKYYKVVETADTLVVWRDIALGEDDSKAIIEIAEKYAEATQIEVNHDFNILATLKDKQLQVGKRLLGLTVIHADIFNQ
ncbi:DNA methyltransferase [Emticicia sp.]|uniref:DNA methyltransferase n=1 Tax=Emticicia sp. TaxID=1930953 RepID=UPI0037509DCD